MDELPGRKSVRSGLTGTRSKAGITGIGRLFFSPVKSIYTATMNTAVISWMLDTVAVPGPAADVIKPRSTMTTMFLTVIEDTMHVMSAMRSPAGKAARFNRRLTKRFLGGCVVERHRSIAAM